MKYFFLIITTAICIAVNAQQNTTQQNTGAATAPQANTATAPVTTTTTTVITPTPTEVSATTAAAAAKPDSCKDCCQKTLGSLEKFYIVLPFFSFLLLVFIVLLSARKAGFNFKQAFYCDDPEEKTEQSPVDPNITIRTTIMKDGEPMYYPSTSKLIAFLTGLTTLIVIISFITYYAYCMMNCRTLPEFKTLFEVLMALGLGIIPYGISKVTNAGKQS